MSFALVVPLEEPLVSNAPFVGPLDPIGDNGIIKVNKLLLSISGSQQFYHAWF